MSTPPCWRCHRLTETHCYSAVLWLCAECPLQPICAPACHEWRGTGQPGRTWVCLACGTLLGSQPINTDIVWAPTVPAEED